MPPVNPMGKIAYLCDEVVRDAVSGKLSYLGIFEGAVSPSGAGYPFRLGRLCVAAQLAGGLGPVSVHVEVVEGATLQIARAAGPFPVAFTGRQRTMTVCVRLLDVEFSAPGVYFVELYAQGVFLDDRSLRLR